jgi:hypothetical protein
MCNKKAAMTFTSYVPDLKAPLSINLSNQFYKNLRQLDNLKLFVHVTPFM